jgi:hypothetical protein
MQLRAIVPRMWHLNMCERGGEWVTVGTFESVAAAARKILELEASSAYGVFFQIYIETGLGALSEEQAFGHLEHSGKRHLYTVKRIQH